MRYLRPSHSCPCGARHTLCLFLALVMETLWLLPAYALEFPGPGPGRAEVQRDGQVIQLHNAVIGCSWSVAGERLQPLRLEDRIAGRSLELTGTEAFRITFADGRIILASQLKWIDAPLLDALPGRADAFTRAQRSPGQQITLHAVEPESDMEIHWRAILRDHSNGIRQEMVLRARRQPVPIREIRFIEVPGQGAEAAGTVPGSPIVLHNWFLAYEHPDSSASLGSMASAALKFNFALVPNTPIEQSAVMGVVPEGQLRRGFLYYVERERAHPYRPFLHYNAWYDICWGNRKIDEQECLNVVEEFGRELTDKRGLRLDSFVWDDGWDDPKTLWRPITGKFPNGFTKILSAARQHQSTLGFWLSPFGGYGQPKEDRIAMGKSQGFEIGAQGFSLAGPRYYARFLETCAKFIDQDGANFFKFDGLARSVDETDAMLRLTRALRERKPDLFISITTGTWPSPFWLWYGDSTWRGGGDMGFDGAGSKREQWVTYRDGQTYSNIVRAAPLYPLNSLMTQGFAHARYGTASEVGGDTKEIRRELRSFFASGTCLQELYVTPSFMTPESWDDLAECAKWAHANRDVLVDTHWVGGDPARAEPYGWAAWAPRKGIIALRNPASQRKEITIDVGLAFQLPAHSQRRFFLHSPWRDDAAQASVTVEAGVAHTFQLAAFEVLVFDADPR